MNSRKTVLFVVCIVVCLFLITFLLYNKDKGIVHPIASSSDQQNVTDQLKKDRIETYLLIGTDASGSENASGESYQGNMADFLMLVVINRTQDKYSFLQINRDTMTEVKLMQHDGSTMASADIQICTSHWYGGNQKQSCENTVNAVSNLLHKIPIKGYYCVNMDVIPTLNHEVGGVTVTVKDDFSKVDPSLVKGETIQLSDEQAYEYVHNRYDVEDETNVSRMARQQEYMSAFLAKIKEIGKADKEFSTRMWKKMKSQAVTNIKAGELSKIGNFIIRSDNHDSYTIEGTSKLGSSLGDGLEHVEFYPDQNSIKQILSQLNLKK